MNCDGCGRKLEELDEPAMLVVEAVVTKNSYLPKRVVQAYCRRCWKKIARKAGV